jgi:hypothetical protein
MSSIIKVNTYQDANGNALFSSDGSGNLTGTNKLGITHADMWRLSSDKSLTANVESVVSANWEQVDTANFTPIGSAMTQSSGIFTFPTTGIWEITYCALFNGPSQGATYAGGPIFISTDNFSTETRATEIYSSMYHPSAWTQTVAKHIFDVTNTSTHKCKFYAVCEFNSTLSGNTSKNRTSVTFIRLGDT